MWNCSHKALDPCFMCSSYKGIYCNVKCEEFCVSSLCHHFSGLLLYSDSFCVCVHVCIHTHPCHFQSPNDSSLIKESGVVVVSLVCVVDYSLNCSHKNWLYQVRPKLSWHLATENLSSFN